MTTWNGFFFHSPASFMIEIVSLIHDYAMIFLGSIIILVLLNLSYTVVRSYFSQTFYDSHLLEWTWTVTPFILLVFILIPSLESLYISDSCFYCGLTIRVIGHQWYWRYFYKDLFSRSFDSYITPSRDRQVRLLEVDNRLVIPTNFPLRFLLSSADVIHSWAVPSFGIKFDAIPGRISQFCFSSKRSGIFFGQCSEICGANHSFIPISLECVPFNFFF